jgi:hypothetical protein
MGAAAAAVPARVARMEGTLSQLESGDLKLRVRVLEQERAARRSGVVQVGTCCGLCKAGGSCSCLAHVGFRCGAWQLLWVEPFSRALCALLSVVSFIAR